MRVFAGLVAFAGCTVPDAAEDTEVAVGDTADSDQPPETDGPSDTDIPTDTDAPTDTGDTDGWDPGDYIIGVDVSGWNPDIVWETVAEAGVAFAYVKATQGVTYESSQFASQYNGSYEVGLIRGAYHFATPDESDGADQADFFVDNGGGWSDDGQTLPGALDMEWNPYGSSCYDLSKSEMAAWVADFNDEYIARTGRAPTIYTSSSWWNSCVGTSDLGSVNPLWVANWYVDSPALPKDWSEYTFWQYTSEGDLDGIDGDVDVNLFNGGYNDLITFALQ